jgi:hypothetical protein
MEIMFMKNPKYGRCAQKKEKEDKEGMEVCS